MTNLSTEHWHYLHTKPLAQGIIKSRPEDFVVIEELVPESQTSGHSHAATMGAMLGFAVMMTLDVALG